MERDASVAQNDVVQPDEMAGSSMPACPVCGRGFDSLLKFCPHDGALLQSSLSGEKSRVGLVIDDKYRLVRLIGEGGMAEVYEAHHLFLQKKVAIKFLKSMYASEQSLLERFRREALLISMISHPTVVKIEDFGALGDGTLFMIMELLVGDTLAGAIKKAPMNLLDAVDVVIQTSEGIAAAHEKGIIHRDLKPSNLFLVGDGPGTRTVKILDLGIAKLCNEGVDRSITRTGIVVGSPNYMAPEQCMGAHVDYRSDIYALGMILYELAADRVPFEGTPVADLILMHTTIEPTRPSVRAPERNIPQELEDIIVRAIAKKPEERFGCVRDMGDALRQVAIAMGKTPDTPRVSIARPGLEETAKTREIVTLVEHAANANVEPAIEIAPGIFWAGRRAGELLERNTYLLRLQGRGHHFSIVVDPGPYCDLQVVTAKINSIIGSLQAVDVLFLNHQDPDVAANAAFLQRASSRAVVWCSEDSWRLSRFYDLMPDRRIIIEQFWNRSITLPTGHQLQFIPTPFCHARGAVMLYDPNSRVLFSGDLLGGLSAKGSLIANAACWAGIRSFHELYMPSSEALKNAVAQIRAISPPPLIIAPQHGSIIPEPLIDIFLQRLTELEVGVNFVLTSHSKTNYLRAINELLPEISAVLGTEKIADTLGHFSRDESFRKLFTVVDNMVLDIRMDPEAAMALLLQQILSNSKEASDAFRLQAIVMKVLQRWSLVPPDVF